MKNIETEFQKLPLIPLRNILVFPGEEVRITLNDKNDILAANAAEGTRVALVLQRGPKGGEIRDGDLFDIGVIAKCTISERSSDNSTVTIKVIVESRCLLKKIIKNSRGYSGFVRRIADKPFLLDESMYNYQREYILATARDLVAGIPAEIEKSMMDAARKAVDNPSMFADVVASAFLLGSYNKQKVLEELDVELRLVLVINLLESTAAKLSADAETARDTKDRMDAKQRRFFLIEQLKTIRNELGDIAAYEGEQDATTVGELMDDVFAEELGTEIDGEVDDEIGDYRKKLDAIKEHLDADSNEKIKKAILHLDKLSDRSSDANVLRNYLDCIFDLPWGKYDTKPLKYDNAKKTLERDHYGLEKVKNRILEYIASFDYNGRKTAKNSKNAKKNGSPDTSGAQIICLVGAPGVGKTSVASSVARALGRKYVRVSLGGVRDESDIRGHRKTYVASMPGRIVEGIVKAKSMNPLVLLDEIDKMGHDFRGDPASAMLEVLDSEQNKAFRDHFLEIPLDLSSCVFIATANNIDAIPRPLLDRMEIIELPIYNRVDKFSIARDYLIPKLTKRHSLGKSTFKLTDDALYGIIDLYTHEAGVRALEREIASLCRKAVKLMVESEGKPEPIKSVKIDADNLHEFLGAPKYLPEKLYEHSEIGIVNGLAYTELGGELLRIEAVSMPGTGKLELTGSLGDVMKESAKIAISYIRLVAEKYGIDPDFHKNRDMHIHFPDGATPKDGPSAGTAIVCALCSELSGVPVRRDAALTGEVTLHGRVTAIGGLREKTMAAYRAGIKTVLIPEENRKNIADIDEIVKRNVEIIFVSTADQAIERLLEFPSIKTVENNAQRATHSAQVRSRQNANS